MSDVLQEKRCSIQSDNSEENINSIVQFNDSWSDERIICAILHEETGNCINTGKNLAIFLDNISIINDENVTNKKQAYSMGCLAAQYVKEYKKHPGELFLVDKNCHENVTWLYTVSQSGDVFNIQVKHNKVEIFAGDLSKFKEFCEVYIHNDLPTVKRFKPFSYSNITKAKKNLPIGKKFTFCKSPK